MTIPSRPSAPENAWLNEPRCLRDSLGRNQKLAPAAVIIATFTTCFPMTVFPITVMRMWTNVHMETRNADPHFRVGLRQCSNGYCAKCHTCGQKRFHSNNPSAVINAITAARQEGCLCQENTQFIIRSMAFSLAPRLSLQVLRCVTARATSLMCRHLSQGAGDRLMCKLMHGKGSKPRVAVPLAGWSARFPSVRLHP
jgi:hypothetical protein